MATTKILASSIPAAKLATAINKAVELSAAKLKVDVLSENIVHKWDLVGRVVQSTDLAHAFATDVTKQLNKTAGLKAEPVTLIINKQIIAGFIDRSRISDALRLL